VPLSERVETEYSQAVTIDMHTLILGERLGDGLSREVFVFAYDPRFVVKVEARGNFQNVTEYLVWEAVRGTEWARWFAPVERISALGSVLVMRRAREPSKRQLERFPRELPDFLADSRPCNWGLIGGRWVMCDYGMTRLVSNQLKSARMVPADAVASAFSTRAKAG
jgi:hypothetical protein